MFSGRVIFYIKKMDPSNIFDKIRNYLENIRFGGKFAVQIEDNRLMAERTFLGIRDYINIEVYEEGERSKVVVDFDINLAKLNVFLLLLAIFLNLCYFGARSIPVALSAGVIYWEEDFIFFMLYLILLFSVIYSPIITGEPTIRRIISLFKGVLVAEKQ